MLKDIHVYYNIKKPEVNKLTVEFKVGGGVFVWLSRSQYSSAIKNRSVKDTSFFGIHATRGYPLPTPDEQARRSSVGVCEGAVSFSAEQK
jgi:hypothetical protein